MRPFKFFTEYVDVNNVFQYEIDGIYKQFEITKYTFLTLDSNLLKLLIDFYMEDQEFYEMINDLKYTKRNGTIFTLSEDGILTKTIFSGVLYSSERVLNTNESKLEFFLDFYNVV